MQSLSSLSATRCARLRARVVFAALWQSIGEASLRLAAYTALRYGKPYLAWAIRSIIDAVDDYYVLYARYPSHGSDTPMACPDTEEELRAIAQGAAGNKLVWIAGDWRHENEQRESIYHYLKPDTDGLLVLDSDEIWKEAELGKLVWEVLSGQERHCLAWGVHFWRSFYWAVTDDRASPVRGVNLTRQNGSRIIDVFFAHMGYAQPKEYIYYKMQIHGHKNEWRPEWYTEKFLANIQEDIHPTNERGFWNAVPVQPLDWLPKWMGQHPYAELGVIE